MKPSLSAHEAAWASKQREEGNVIEEPMRHRRREVQRTAFPARQFLLLLVYSSVCISAAADQSQSPDARGRKQMLWLAEKRNSWSIHSAFFSPPWSVFSSSPALSSAVPLMLVCVWVCVFVLSSRVFSVCLSGFRIQSTERAHSVLWLQCSLRLSRGKHTKCSSFFLTEFAL